MERSLLNELTDQRLQAYLKKNRFSERYWPSLFPLEYRDELTWESLTGTEGSTIKADVISYDSSAPEKGREIIGKASGKIAKMAVKRSMREEDFLMYKRLKKGAASDTEKQAILDLVFNDINFVVNAINANTEYLALQAASTGQITLDKENNNGIVTEKEIDLGIPKGNKTFVSELLTDADNFNFIGEVKKIDKAARAKGVKLNYMFTDPETIDAVLETKKIKAAYGYFLTQTHNEYLGTLFLDDLNKLLAKNRLPQIILIDTYVRHEDKNHKRTTLQPWKPGYISFTVEKSFGKTQHGPIAEEDAESVKKYAIQAKKGHCLVTKWSDVDPVVEQTKGEAHCFPVLKGVEDIYILNTNSTTKFI
jgi:hypothetical protein